MGQDLRSDSLSMFLFSSVFCNKLCWHFETDDFARCGRRSVLGCKPVSWMFFYIGNEHPSFANLNQHILLRVESCCAQAATSLVTCFPAPLPGQPQEESLKGTTHSVPNFEKLGGFTWLHVVFKHFALLNPV